MSRRSLSSDLEVEGFLEREFLEKRIGPPVATSGRTHAHPSLDNQIRSPVSLRSCSFGKEAKEAVRALCDRKNKDNMTGRKGTTARNVTACEEKTPTELNVSPLVNLGSRSYRTDPKQVIRALASRSECTDDETTSPTGSTSASPRTTARKHFVFKGKGGKKKGERGKKRKSNRNSIEVALSTTPNKKRPAGESEGEENDWDRAEEMRGAPPRGESSLLGAMFSLAALAGMVALALNQDAGFLKHLSSANQVSPTHSASNDLCAVSDIDWVSMRGHLEPVASALLGQAYNLFQELLLPQTISMLLLYALW